MARAKRKNISMVTALRRFGLVLSIALGLGFSCRYYFKSTFFRTWVESRLAQWDIPVEVSFGKVSLALSDGWKPMLAFRVDDLKVKHPDCTTEVFRSSNSYFVLKTMSVFSGPIELSEAKFKQSKVLWKPSESWNCESQVGFFVSGKPKYQLISAVEKVESVKNKIDDFLKTINIQKKFNALESVVLKKIPMDKLAFEGLSIDYVGNGKNPLNINTDLDIHFVKGRWVLSGNIESIFIKKKAYSFDKFGFLVKASDKVWKFTSDIKLREGTWDIVAAVKPDGELRFTSTMAKIPLSYVTEMMWPEAAYKLQFLWLDCNIYFAGKLSAWSQIPFATKGCKATGPHGEVIAVDQEIRPFDDEFLSPLKIKISKLDLDKILNTRKDLFLSGVFDHYGLLGGKVSLSLKEGAVFSGKFKEASVVFSRSGARVAQKIQVDLKGHYRERLSALVESANIEGGDFKGVLSVSYDVEKGNGIGQVAIHSLKFRPEVTETLVSSRLKPLQVYGKFNWTKGKLESWRGYFLSKGAKAENLNLGLIKAQTEYKSGVFKSNIVIKEGELLADSFFYQWLAPAFLDKPPAKLNVVDTSVRIEVKKNEVMWSSGHIQLKEGNRLTTQGLWKDKKFDFDVSSKHKKGNTLWKLKGSFDAMAWYPQKPWMIDWIESNKEYSKRYPQVILTQKEKL